ncbi:MAG: thioredoxin-dependent thiol peroxidase [Roseiflexaceae bacterium]|jgi:peroxiredoxin Q/BCP
MSTLAIGDVAPDFTLHDDAGQSVTLSQYRGQRVVIFFYPKDDTPGCTTQACGFRDNHQSLLSAGAVVLGISPDDVKSHAKFKQKFNLPFPLLADTDHAVCEAYGVWGEKSMYGKKYMGVTRSHFVVGLDGTLVDVQIKVSPEESVSRAIKQIINS